MLYCQIASFSQARIRQMVMYFPRYLIASTTITFSAVVMKFLGKYIPM